MVFLTLPKVGKADVLARVAHWETIRARDVYVQRNGQIDGDILRHYNEYVHHIAGHISAVLRGRTTADQDISFIYMIIEVSVLRGQEELERLAAWLREAQGIFGSNPTAESAG